MPEKLVVTCSMCGKPVPLEDCKCDDNGHPVHEACYAAEVAAQGQKSAATA